MSDSSSRSFLQRASSRGREFVQNVTGTVTDTDRDSADSGGSSTSSTSSGSGAGSSGSSSGITGSGSTTTTSSPSSSATRVLQQSKSAYTAAAAAASEKLGSVLSDVNSTSRSEDTSGSQSSRSSEHPYSSSGDPSASQFSHAYHRESSGYHPSPSNRAEWDASTEEGLIASLTSHWSWNPFGSFSDGKTLISKNIGKKYSTAQREVNFYAFRVWANIAYPPFIYGTAFGITLGILTWHWYGREISNGVRSLSNTAIETTISVLDYLDRLIVKILRKIVVWRVEYKRRRGLLPPGERGFLSIFNFDNRSNNNLANLADAESSDLGFVEEESASPSNRLHLQNRRGSGGSQPLSSPRGVR